MPRISDETTPQQIDHWEYFIQSMNTMQAQRRATCDEHRRLADEAGAKVVLADEIIDLVKKLYLVTPDETDTDDT